VIGLELKDLKKNKDEIIEVRGRHVARKDNETEKQWNG
jgi:hypothetical protein